MVDAGYEKNGGNNMPMVHKQGTEADDPMFPHYICLLL